MPEVYNESSHPSGHCFPSFLLSQSHLGSPASRDPISDPLGSKSVSKTTEEERRGCEEGRQPFTKVRLGPAPGIICTRENSALLLVPSLELGFVILSGVTGVLKVVYFCQGLS